MVERYLAGCVIYQDIIQIDVSGDDHLPETPVS